MSTTIAISGKGGVGKSTFAALIVRCLVERAGRAVLAVDADANATLGTMLGVEVEHTVADFREETLEKKDAIPASMSKDRFVQYRIQQAIGEHKGFDLLTMGRPEGPGCYCYVNNLLRRYLDGAADDYPFVVIDNEAGMEHLSRRTNNRVDLLIIVTEATVIGADTAARITELAGKLPIPVARTVLVVNRVLPDGISPEVRSRLEATGLDIAGQIPLDTSVLAASASGQSLLELPDNNPMYATVCDVLANHAGIAAASQPQSTQ